MHLSEQFRQLNLQLTETNHQLHHKVGELHLITDYLKNILDNMSQGIIFLDLEGTITTYNKAAEEILGITGTKVLAKAFWHSFPDDIFGFSIKKALTTKEAPATACIAYHLADGSQRELELVTTLVLDEEFQEGPSNLTAAEIIPTQGIILMVRDVTDLRHLQLLANRNDRMKELGEMAAQMAHEIRNPLGGIKGFASLLKRDLKDHPQQQKMAEQIIEGTHTLNTLVTQVLDYARPPLPHFERIDMSAFLKNIGQEVLAYEDFNSQNISLKLESDENISLDIDPHLFKSALLNLMINSIQAMPQGGILTVSLHQQHRVVILTVTDTGEGISHENMEKVFTPFFTTKPNGNGFGLAEVHKAILAHHGTVEVKSAVGKGTTFTIKLPRKT
jgi:PAS domain S-box-containing protein